MGGSPGRRSAAAGLLALAVAVPGAPSGAPGPVVGADTERPVQPETGLVRFDDVASEVGLGFRHGAFQWETTGDPPAMMGGGLCWLDFDRDGWMDLFVTNTWSNGEWGRWRAEDALPTSHLFAQRPGSRSPTSPTRPAPASRAGQRLCRRRPRPRRRHRPVRDDRTRQRAAVERRRPLRRRRRRPPGSMPTVGTPAPPSGMSNGDGWPDLFVSGYVDMNRRIPGATKGFPNTHGAEPDLLFVSLGPDEDGRVSFRDVAEVAGIEPDGPSTVSGQRSAMSTATGPRPVRRQRHPAQPSLPQRVRSMAADADRHPVRRSRSERPGSTTPTPGWAWRRPTTTATVSLTSS